MPGYVIKWGRKIGLFKINNPLHLSWVSVVMCDRRRAAGVVEKVYKMVVRLAIMYDLETVAQTKRQQELEVAGMKMLKFSLEWPEWTALKMRISKGQLMLSCLQTKLERKDLWFGHVRRTDRGYTGQSMLSMELPEGERGRPERRFMGVVKKDKQRVGVTEEDAKDGMKCRHWSIFCDH